MTRWKCLPNLILLTGLLCPALLFSKATISGKIQNLPKDSLSISLYSPPVSHKVQQQYSANGSYTISLELQNPVFLLLKCGAYSFNLILAPDDQIQLDFDAKDMRNTFSVGGSPANSFYLKSKSNPLWAWTATERGPDHLSTFLQFMDMMQQEKEEMEEQGIRGQLKSLLEYEVDYFFIHQMMLLTRDYPSYDRPIYMAEINELLTTELIDNGAALPSPAYGKFLFDLADYHWKYESEEFKKGIYPAYGTAGANILGFYHAFWHKNLTKGPRELILATCLSRWTMYNQIRATEEIYTAFKRDFPNSRYLSELEAGLEELLPFWKLALLQDQDIPIMEPQAESFEELRAIFEKKVTVLFIWKRSLDVNGIVKKAMIHSALTQHQLDPQEVEFIYLTIDDVESVDQLPLRDLFIYYRLRGRHLVLKKDEALTKSVHQELFKDLKHFPPVILIFDQNRQTAKKLSSFQIRKDLILGEVKKLSSN